MQCCQGVAQQQQQQPTSQPASSSNTGRAKSCLSYLADSGTENESGSRESCCRRVLHTSSILLHLGLGISRPSIRCYIITSIPQDWMRLQRARTMRCNRSTNSSSNSSNSSSSNNINIHINIHINSSNSSSSSKRTS